MSDTEMEAMKTRSMALKEDLADAKEHIRQLEDKIKSAEKEKISDDKKTKVQSVNSDCALTWVRPTKYDGSIDFVDYLAQFSTVARYHGWDASMQAIVLMAQLEGRALCVAAHCVSYAEMVEVLTSAFSERQKDTAALSLRSRRQADGEDFGRLSLDLQKLTRLAYPKADATMLETLSVEAFVNALCDDTIRSKVRDAEPVTMSSAVSCARKFHANKAMESQRNPKAVNVVCNIDPRVEQVEKQLHVLSEQVSSLMRGRQRNSSIQCFLCGGFGHIKRNCPKNQGNGQGAGYKDSVSLPQSNVESKQ